MDVLSYVMGQRSVETGGGSTEPFFVTIGDSGSDKTFAEIVEAFTSGRCVWCKASGQDWYDLLTSINWDEDTSTFSATFGSNNIAEAEAYDEVLYWSGG